MKKLKIAVLISGRGSNLQSLIDACANPDFPAEIVCVISNNIEAYGIERAHLAGIEATVIDHREFADRPAFDEALQATIKESGAELVCLAGFMRLLTKEFVGRWKNRLINIHPSLLPAYKGLHTHERVIEDGVRFTGCTIHFVRPEMDDGPIILQAAIPVRPDDSPDLLAARVLAQEHILYPEAVRLIADGRVRVMGNTVRVQDAEAPDLSLVNPMPQ